MQQEACEVGEGERRKHTHLRQLRLHVLPALGELPGPVEQQPRLKVQCRSLPRYLARPLHTPQTGPQHRAKNRSQRERSFSITGRLILCQEECDRASPWQSSPSEVAERWGQDTCNHRPHTTCNSRPLLHCCMGQGAGNSRPRSAAKFERRRAACGRTASSPSRACCSRHAMLLCCSSSATLAICSSASSLSASAGASLRRTCRALTLSMPSRSSSWNHREPRRKWETRTRTE